MSRREVKTFCLLLSLVLILLIFSNAEGVWYTHASNETFYAVLEANLESSNYVQICRNININGGYIFAKASAPPAGTSYIAIHPLDILSLDILYVTDLWLDEYGSVIIRKLNFWGELIYYIYPSYPEYPYPLHVCSLYIEVKNPRIYHGLRSPFVVTFEDIVLDSYQFMSDSFFYELDLLIDPNSNENIIEPHKAVTIKVYPGSEAQGEPIYEIQKDLMPKSNNHTTIDLTGLIDANKIDLSSFLPAYEDKVFGWQGQITLPEPDPYPWNQKNLLPGDMDANFPPGGDFDGDKILNYDEHLLSSCAVYPTVQLFLLMGVNLYYFPSVRETPNIGLSQVFHYDPNADPNTVPWILEEFNPLINFYYDDDLKKWLTQDSGKFTSNTFNAIKTNDSGILNLDLTKLNHPILHLRGFSCEYLDTNLIDPNSFDTNASTLGALKTIDSIEMISGQNHRRGSWEASYSFFHKPAGDNMHLRPDQVYTIYRKGEHAP